MFRVNSRTQKMIIVSGLLTASLILGTVLYESINRSGIDNRDISKNTQKFVDAKTIDSSKTPMTTNSNITMPEIKEDKSGDNTQAVVPSDKMNVVVPLTQTDTAKPAPPPVPKITVKGDKNVKPAITPEKPSTQEPSQPSAGDTNNKGQTYVPGFGWVGNSGPNQGGASNSTGDINKQIGKMN